MMPDPGSGNSLEGDRVPSVLGSIEQLSRDGFIYPPQADLVQTNRSITRSHG
jgi:hypothetical protein